MSVTIGASFFALTVGLSGSSRNAASNASEIFLILSEVSAGIAYLMSSGLQAVLAARFFLAGVERLLVFYPYEETSFQKDASYYRNALRKDDAVLGQCILRDYTDVLISGNVVRVFTISAAKIYKTQSFLRRIAVFSTNLSNSCGKWRVILAMRIITWRKKHKKRPGAFCSPLTGVTTNSGDPPTGYRVYDACRGSSVFRGCRLSMS